MRELLDFLTANPLLLIFLIGAIAGLVKKDKKPPEKRKAKQTAAQGEQKKKQQFDWREIVKELKQELEGAPQKEVQEKPAAAAVIEETVTSEASQSHELLEKYERTRQRSRNEVSDRYRQKNSPILKGDLTAPAKIDMDFSKITREDAMKGVIWAEVLGKPRSKASFRPVAYSKRSQG